MEAAPVAEIVWPRISREGTANNHFSKLIARPLVAKALKNASRWRRLDIPTGQQTYRAIKVKLIILLTNNENTKNVIQLNKDFLFKHILIYIIFY